jgi:hypothetical protein
MKSAKSLLAPLVLGLVVLPATAQTPAIQKEVEAKLLAQRERRAEEQASARTQRELYEEIEIMARLLDRGLAKLDGVRSVTFSPDGKRIYSESIPGTARLWDVQTGRQISGHTSLDLAGVQGVYLKGQGIVFTVTLPAHFHKVVGGWEKVETKTLSEWDRTRRELRGEKIETEKPRERDETSIADALLKVLAENGKHLTHLAEGESVTVVVTLAHVQNLGVGTGGMMGGMPGAGGMMGGAPGMTSSGNRGSGGLSGSSAGGSSGGFSGGSAGGGSGSSLGSGSSSGPSDGDSARSDFRKYALMGDLALKQNDYVQATDAYQKAIGQYHKLPHKEAVELEVIEVASKLARALIASGKNDEAEKIVQSIVKLSAGLKSGERPAEEKAEMRLPGKLIIKVPRTLLNAAGEGKTSFDKFREAASVEYLPFDKPTTEKPKGSEAAKP